MSIDLSAWHSQLLTVLLLIALFYTLKAVTTRLYSRARLRFVLVALSNIACVLVLIAWLGKLQVTTPASEHLTLTTDGAEGEKADPGVFVQQNPAMTEVSVQGFGLLPQQWQDFKGMKVHFDPPPVNTGPVKLSWPKKLHLGERLTIKGQWHSNQGRQIVTLKLFDPAQMEVDSTRVRKGESFQLSAKPKAQGYYFYHLQAVDQAGLILSEEPVAVFVGQSPAVKLMVLQSTPSFETRHLKNWVTEQGGGMLMLSTISKERYQSLAVNLPDTQDRTFSPASLAYFDLLLADGRALVQLGPGKLTMLQQAVEQGLGLMVLVDKPLVEAAQSLSLLKGYSFNPLAAQMDGRLNMPGSDVLFDAAPYELSATDGPMLEISSNDRILGVYRQHGLGKVAVSSLNNRYRWRLNGQFELYSSHWQSLLKRLARVRRDSRIITPSDELLPMPGQRLPVCILSQQQQVQLWWQGKPLTLMQDSINPNRYCAFVWPPGSGWQTFELTGPNGEKLDYLALHVYAPQQWQSAVAAQKVAASRAFVEGQNHRVSRERQSINTNMPVDNRWLGLLLLLFASILWWERKMDSQS